MEPSVRAEIVTRRTYSRPKDDGTFETWEDIVDRVINHQRWLWRRALGRPLNMEENNELLELRQLILDRKVSVSGRTLWMGGTQTAKERESSQFNCAHLRVETVYDVVDVMWLLLQGCGVGFTPVTGTLNGFRKHIDKIDVVRSVRKEKGGREENYESWDSTTKTWYISIGDSAKAWAKSIGKLLAGKYPADKLVLDFSNIRPAGERLSGYGWISSGDEQIAKAYLAIAELLNRKAGELLTCIDILDICNWLGTTLSSRRSAEICLMDAENPEWKDFVLAKKDYWLHNNFQRCQSNNSLVFYAKPDREKLKEIFDYMAEAGGSEPGFINGEAAKKRAPWFAGVNPCGEILLGNKGLCNLVEVDVSKFVGDGVGLLNAIKLIARANYRQTCVNLKDGVLQEAWHLNQDFLRLCGVGLTGVALRDDISDFDYRVLRVQAITSAIGMADELGLPHPKNVTTIKPSGTLSKIMDTTEGVHKPLAKYIFNNVNFSTHDPIVDKLKQAGYHTFINPNDSTSVLVRFPVKWDGVAFDEVNGMQVNTESAWDQLERYRRMQHVWTQQNTSVTISYSPEEVDAILDWLDIYWDSYVGVSFIYRTDPTKTAADLGYLYLPQEATTEELYNQYVAGLKPVSFDEDDVDTDLAVDAGECAGGVCPVK